MTSQHEHRVRITRGEVTLEGILGLPVDPRGIAVSAHGSGSGRSAPGICSSPAIYSKTDSRRCSSIY